MMRGTQTTCLRDVCCFGDVRSLLIVCLEVVRRVVKPERKLYYYGKPLNNTMIT